MSDRHIFVTGGAGYIGSHVCKALRNQGYTPVVLDNLSNSRKDSVKWGPFERGTTNSGRLLKDIIKKYKPEAVIHLAGSIDNAESLQVPGKYYKNNTIATAKMIDILTLEGVNKIIFSSTAGVYGPPYAEPMVESHPKGPISPYAKSKLFAEEIIRDVGVAKNINHVIFRYFNAAGADPEGDIGEDHKRETHLIPLAIETAYRNKNFKIYGNDYLTEDGTCIRDYVHVSDIAAAHVLALKYLEVKKENITLNLGTGTGSSVKNVVRIVEVVTKKQINAQYCNRRPGDQASLVANANLAKAILGWKPKYDVEDTIRHAAKWISERRARRSVQ